MKYNEIRKKVIFENYPQQINYLKKKFFQLTLLLINQEFFYFIQKGSLMIGIFPKVNY